MAAFELAERSQAPDESEPHLNLPLAVLTRKQS
jgi:hypothetical protein